MRTVHQILQFVSLMAETICSQGPIYLFGEADLFHICEPGDGSVLWIFFQLFKTKNIFIVTHFTQIYGVLFSNCRFVGICTT